MVRSVSLGRCPPSPAFEDRSEALWRDASKAQDLSERVFTEQRTAELRKRYLTLQLDGLRPRKKAQPLPGPPPQWNETFRSGRA